jgi:uncharacterized protein (DUF1800 family)
MVDERPIPFVSRRQALRGAVTVAGAVGALTAARSAQAQGDDPNSIVDDSVAFDALLLEGAQALTLPPLEIIVLNRLAYGPRPGALDFQSFRDRPGSTPEQKLQSWVDWQLNPGAIGDAECDQRLALLGSETAGKSLNQQWIDYHRTDMADRVRPVKDVRAMTLTRAVYSQRQLYEMVVEFWHNHFSIYAWDYAYASTTFQSFDRDVIRPNALGNFTALLTAVTKSTAMLFYLDNYLNDKGSNENWAREVIELHTLGSENYLGTGKQQNEVPGYPSAPIGYVDTDVYEAARAFAGWRVKDDMWVPSGGPQGTPVAEDNGDFYFDGRMADRFQKTVLGRSLRADPPPMDHGAQVLDALARHPGTARYICRKLIRRFVTDAPPQALVESAAQVFQANLTAPDQIARVLRHVLLSDTFRASWGQKVKRPYEFAVATMRATRAVVQAQYDGLYWSYDDMGQSMFAWRPPNGFPDVAGAWVNTSGMLSRWSWCNRMTNGWIDHWANGSKVADVVEADLAGQTPTNTHSAQVVDFWINRILGRPLANPANRQAMIDFLRDNKPETQVLNRDQGWQDRLKFTVAMVLQTVDFQWR